MAKQIEVKPGDEVRLFTHPDETFTVLTAGVRNSVQLRAADGREFWQGTSLISQVL